MSLLQAALFILPGHALASDVTVPSVVVKDDGITVSASLKLDEGASGDLQKGIPKEIVFFVDLFRVWPTWPDEFVIGKTVTRSLKCDPIKKEYTASSFDGIILVEKRFQSCRTMADWALRVPEMKLTSVSELEPSDYFVRVTAESRLRTLPPVIGYLFFFVREKEFSIHRDSERFRPGGGLPGGGQMNERKAR